MVGRQVCLSVGSQFFLGVDCSTRTACVGAEYICLRLHLLPFTTVRMHACVLDTACAVVTVAQHGWELSGQVRSPQPTATHAQGLHKSMTQRMLAACPPALKGGPALVRRGCFCRCLRLHLASLNPVM